MAATSADPRDPAEAEFPLRAHLGMEITAPGPGRGAARLSVGPEHLNPNGVVHGAVLFAMVDTAMGAAVVSILEEGRICASVDVHLRFIRPVARGDLDVEARVVHPGRRMVQLEATAHDDEGHLVATASGAFVVLESPGA